MSHEHPPPPPDEPAGSDGPPEGPGDAAVPPPNPYGAAPPPPNPYGSPAPPVGASPESGPVTRPRSMDIAVLLMKVGAAVAALSVLSVLVQGDSIRSAIEQSLQDSGQSVTQGTVDLAVTVGTVASVVSGLAGAALWWWMAVVNGRGRSWARIVASVFFGLSTLSLLASLIQPQPVLGRALGVLQWLVGLAVVVLIWRAESTRFYLANAKPRY